MEKLTDPTLYLKLSDSFVKYLKKNSNELLKEQLPKNLEKVIREINTEQQTSLLNTDDIEWFQNYLRNKNIYSCSDSFVEGSVRQSDELSECDMNLVYDAILRDKNKLTKEIVKTGNFECDHVWLHELLDGCDMVLPKNELTQRNPELEARIQRLKKEQEDREYRAMTKNVSTEFKFVPEDTMAFQLRMMNRHLIGVGQFVMSVAAGFAFGFVGIQYMVGELDFGFRILLGIMFALIIALAEIYFLAKHLAEEYEDDVPLFGGRKPPGALSNKTAQAKPHQD